MAQTIKLKRSAVAGRIPNVSDLELGEIAINTYDGKMYIKKSVNGEESISEIGQDANLGAVFTSYTFTATANQTVFTGNDNSGSALDIVDEFSNVFMNGILLDPEIDFTVSTDGLTLTLTEPAEADDILQINSFDQAIFNGTLNVDALALTGMTGQMAWNSDEETIDVPLNDDVTLQLGQEFVFRGKATEAIANGEAVMFAGAQGGHLLIAKADMSSVGFAPEYVIGIATQDFNTDDFGFVTELGKVRGLDTSGYSEGDILYLDPTTAGALTTTKPTHPNHAIQMCAVVRSHGTQGTLLVRPTHMADTDEIAEGSSNLYFTVARAVAAIKADGDWNASNWDTAFGWGNHADAGYLTSHQDISGKADLSGATFTGDVIVDGGVGVNSSGTFHVRQKGDTVSDGIAITSSYSTAHRIWKDSSGVLNFGVSSNGDQFGIDTSGNLKVNGTTVIDSSRNLTNVPSLTNTSDIAIRPAAGTDILLFNNHNSESQLRLYNNRQDLSYVPVSSVVGYNAEQVAKMVFYRGGNSASGFIRFQDKPSNTSDLRDVFQIGNGIAGSYGVDVLDGSYRVAGTTVIDSDRNLTNIQTLSLCEGTSEKAKLDITSSDNFMLTATGGGGAGLLLWGAGSTVPTISPLKEGVGVNGEVNLGRSNERFNDAWFAGDVIAGNVGIGTSTLYQRLTVSGIIEAGDAATVGGGVGLTLPYNGSTNDYTVNYGGMYSSGGVLIGYGVRSSTDTPNTYTSTYDNFSGVKAALRMDDALRFLASASAVHTRGDAVAMSERFTVKSNGNVGLGVSNPSNRFEIQSAYNNAIVLHDNRTATSGTYRHGIKFNHYNSYANGIYFEHNDYFGIARDACVIEVGNSEKFRISYQGKVGIGLGGSTPAAKLTIQGSSGYTVANSGKAIEGIDVNATAGGTNLGGGAISFGVGGAGRASIAAIQGTGDGDNTELAFNVHGSTSSHDAIEVVRVSSDSRVGINTQSPEQALHVAGAVKVNSAAHSSTINGGLVIDGPAYQEYQFNWNGLTSHTITMTTGSYFMAEVVYTAHQTNSGTDNNEYRRGKWANNYTTHIWEEFENSGNIGAMDTSFTVSENTVSNSGKLVIQENYIAASYSRSTLTVRVYYGSFAITKS